MIKSFFYLFSSLNFNNLWAEKYRIVIFKKNKKSKHNKLMFNHKYVKFFLKFKIKYF